MAGIFQKRGKAAMPVSESRRSLVYGRSWVEFGRAAILPV
jgi:hypothetical protein